VIDRAVVEGKPMGTYSDQYAGNYLTNTCTGNQGAGPFKFVCHDRSSTLHSFYSGSIPKYTLVPNPYYYGRRPHIRLELQTFASTYKAYLAGTLDTTPLTPEYLNHWRGQSTQYHPFPSSIVNYLTPNVHLAPFDNVHCRLALAYAIDRSTLATTVLGGTRRATYTVVPKGMLGYYSGKDNPHYDLAKARAELAKCPDRTTPVTLIYPGSNAAGRNAGHFIVRGLVAAGFNIKLKLVSTSDWLKVVGQPLDGTKTQLAFNGWQQDYPDPQDYCTLLLRSGQFGGIGGWSNATYDRLVDQADGLLDSKKRAQLYIQAQHLALSQGAWISLNYQISFELIKPYVHGLIGTEAVSYLVPKNNDWANVSVSPH
jgi:ABC-type transport system substrate-binding protein